MFDDFSELSKQYGLGGNDDDDSGKIATPPIPSASSSVPSDDDYEALSKAYGLGVSSPASPTSTSTSKRGKRIRTNPGGLTDAELAQAIAQGAKSLGVSPEDYATAIAYETGGTFDPWQAGPTTKWGQHRGTIQYGEPQRKQFGVYQGQGFADQVTGSNVRYLKQRGVRPGATFREIYAAINGGNAKKNLKTFDANTGRTIADNIANANRQWRGIVQNRFGQYWNTGNNSNVSAAADNTDYDSLLARFGSNAEASQFGPNAGSGDLVPDNTDYAALGEQYAPSASPMVNATDLIAGAADKNGQGIRQSGSSGQTPTLPSVQPASAPASPAISTPSPTFAAPYADTSIASGGLTDNKGAASNGAINKSVQEAPDTILAQKNSALANDTQRAAVLTTAPELEDQFFTGDADKGMWTPVKVSQGTLWVNNAKARKLKLRSPEDIAMFVERNPDAMARLIGKVENVGDATEVGQPTVVTTAPDGTELSASAVTSPMAAELQVNLDNLNFPQGTSKITDGSDVVAKRQAATGQQSNTVPANTAQSNSAPATPPKSPAQQAFDLGVDWVKELKKAQANPAKIEQDTESETAPAASNSGSGSVKVELDPSDFKVDGKSITDAEAFERGQEVDGGGVFFVPKRVGAANATLDKAAVAGRFRPPQGLTAEDAARRAFLLAGQRYGATDANWQAYKATEAGQNFLKSLNGVVPDRIDVTYNALAGGGLNAKGDRRMEETISANEIANANAAPRQTYTAPPKGVMEVFGEELDKTLGDRDERGNLTPENEAKKAAYNSPSYDNYIESAFEAMRNMPASPVTPSNTIGNEAIARGAGGLVTSTSQVLSGLYDSSIFGWTDAGVRKGLSAIFGEDAVKQAAPDIAATLGKFGNSVERVAPKGTPDDEYGVTRFVGDVSDGIGRLPVYIGVGAATGGNPILTFAVVDAASARGKGGTLGETLTAGAKGAAMGAAFSGVSRLANSFTDGIFDGSLKNFLKGKLNIPSVYQAPVEATADQVAKETAARQIGAMLNTIERTSTPAGERLAAQKAVERLLTKHNTTVEDVLSGKLTGKVAQEVADAASKENANLLGRYLTKTGINVGLVSGMGYGIAAASGDEHPGRNALLFGAMELLGSLMHIPPKTAREFTPAEIRKVDNTVLRLPSETGQPRDVIVRATPDGKALTVTDVTGRVPDSAITAAMGGKAITKNPAGAGKPLIEPPAIEKPTGVPLPKMPEVELPTESNVKTENAAIKEKQETGKELETTSPISEPTALVGKNEVLPDAETAASKGAVEEVKQGETDAEKAERVGRLTVTAPRTRVGRLDITPAKKAEAEAEIEPVEAKAESVETAEPASVKPYDLTPEAYKEAFPLEKDGQSITAENGKTYELHQGTGGKWWAQEPKTKEIKNFNSRGQMRRFLYGHSSHAQAVEAAIKNGESVDAKILAKYPRLEQKAQKAAGDRIFKFQADETAAPIFGEIAAKGLGAVDKAQLASLQGIGERYHVTPKEVNRLVGASDLAFRRRSAKGKQGQYEDGSRLPSGKVAVGRTASVQIPGEKTKYDVRYVVREANDVQSSHDPFTFQPNLDYELINNRHYDKSDKLQMDVADHAKASKFSADQVVNNAPTAETGTPVIDRNGNALGGNSRVMTIKRVYASENPQAANAYKAKIKADAAAYGIDPTVIDAFKHPILVREVTDKGYDAQSAITDLNKVSAHDLSAQEAAIAGGGRLSPETLDKVGGILGEYGTVGEALNGRGVDIVHDLIKDGVFTENQVTSLLKDDALTEAGKDKVKDVLFGSLFTDLEQLSYAPSNVRNALERIVSPLLQTHADADWDIVPQVREAVDLLTEREAKAKGTTIDEYAGQQSFVRPEGWSPEAVALAKALDGKDAVSKFKTYAGEYRTAQTGSMFGTLTPSDAFKEAFGVEGKASDAKKAKEASKPQATEPPIKSEKSVSPFDTPEGRERMAKERIKALAEEHGVSEQDISAMESAGVLFSTRRDITPEQIIETATDIEKRLIAAGYDARLTRANTTNTRYVTVYKDGYDPIAKIRVSDHDEGALRSNPLNYYGGDNVSDVVQAVRDYKEQSDQDAIKFRAKQDAMRAEIERRRAERSSDLRENKNDATALFSRKTDAADKLLHDKLPFETDFNKVAKGLTGGNYHKDTGELELDPHDAETARRLLNNVHSIRHGIEVNNPSFDGVVLDAGTLRAMAKEALGAAVDMDKTGYAKSQVDAMNALAKNLNAVATHAKDFGIAYVFDSALPEERVHQDDLRAGRTDAQAIKELKENELWDASPKFDRDYEGISSQDKASEIAAKLATGQEVEYGWNRLPKFRELRRKFLETWLDGIARANKETIDAIGIDTFFDKFTRLKEIRDEIKTDTKERGTQSIEPPSEAVGGESGVYGRGESGQGEVGEQGRGTRAETSRVGGTAEGRATRDNSAAETPIDIPTERLPEMPKVELPNDKAEKTAPVESTVKEPTVKEPALAADKPETASTPTTEESGAQKERKTILSAEKWGEVEKDAITGAPRYYRVKSQKPAIAKAQTEIDRIGLDRSFVRALEPLDNVKQEDFAATNIFRREVYYLLGELADKNKGTPAGVAFKEQQEAVLSAMAETGTAGGQLVQSFDPIDRRDARTAVEFTNRQRRKQGWDEPLTEKESEQLKEYAKTLAIQQEALEIAKREIEELKTKAAVGGGGARSSLTGRQKKFITDLRAASDAAIARLHLDEIAPMLSRGTGKRIPNAPLMSRRTPRPSDDELDALADIGANILFDGFQDTDIITQEAFNKRIQEIAGTRYDDHLDLIHAVSMKRLSEMRTEARRQAAIDRVKDANPNATDAEIDKAIADHAKELAERSKARAKHRKTANKVLKAEGIFTEKQKAAYEAKLARQDAKAAQKAQDAVIAAKADADRFIETAVELGYGGANNEDALALALHLYRGDARGQTPIGEKEAIKFLQELRPDLKYRLGETGKESHDRVFETAKVVAEADKIRNAVKARYKAERQAALSALTEKQAAMRERRAAVVKASNEYHDLQKTLATVPPSLRNKIKQTTLMAMVSAFNAAANNGLGGLATRMMYKTVDLTEVGLQRVVKKLFPKFSFAEIAGALPPETKFKDIFGIPTGEDAGFTSYFKDMLGTNALMAQVLSEHPELYRKLFSGHSADIKTYKEIGTGTAPTDRFYRRTSAYRAAHHAADAGIWLYDKLNVFNRLQEYGVRGLEAPYFLQLLAGARGENVRDLVKKGEIGNFTEAELAAAVERALRVTFALSPQKGTTAYKVLDRINKYPMVSLVFAPFARFCWNVWNMGREWLPGVAAFRAAKRVATAENAVWRDITNPSKYTAREAANNIAGLVFFATMFGIVRALGDRDDWYYLRVPGTDKFIDVRQHPEIAPFIYLANKFNRFINGQDLFNYDDTASIANELLEVFFGYSYRQAVDQNSLLRIAPKLLKGKGEEAYNLLSQFIGERVGLFFSPARPLKNFTDSLSRTGDLDLDDSPFTEGLSRQLPKMIFEAAGAPPRTKLGTKDEPKRYSKYAYLKPFGLNIVDGETAEPQTSQTVRGLKKSVYDDGKPYEAPILAADKRERNAKREIYALVNKAEASLPKDADNEAKQVAYAPVRAALKDAVGRNWLTQKQADYIDSRLGKTQAAQLAARASISDALTAYETALKDKLVSQREREEITEAIKKKLTTGKGTITARDIQRAEKLGFTVSPMVRQRAKD